MNALVRDTSLLSSRLALSSTMLYHGAQKVIPRLGGPGLGGTALYLKELGFRRSILWARVLGYSELAAGIALLLGVFSRPAAAAVITDQAVAIAKVHGKKGFSVERGGFEFNLSLIAGALGVLVAGPGAYSLSCLLSGLGRPRAKGLRAKLPARLHPRPGRGRRIAMQALATLG